jgi:hypothetical protein
MHVELYWGQRFVVSIVFEQRTEAVSFYGTEGWSVLYCALPLPLWAIFCPRFVHACNHASIRLPPFRPPAKMPIHSFVHMTTALLGG